MLRLQFDEFGKPMEAHTGACHSKPPTTKRITSCKAFRNPFRVKMSSESPETPCRHLSKGNARKPHSRHGGPMECTPLHNSTASKFRGKFVKAGSDNTDATVNPQIARGYAAMATCTGIGIPCDSCYAA